MLRPSLERHNHLDSVIHRLPAGLKLSAALVLIIAAVSVPMRHAWLLGVVGAVVLTALLLSRLPLRFVLLRLAIAEPLVLGASLLSLFQPQGWRLFLLIVARCTVCLLVAVVLAGTTPFNDLVRVLRRIRVPAILLTTLALMYRYLFVLMEESARMNTARASRSFTRRRWWHWRVNAGMIARLFVRAGDRAERIYLAMCARGWR